MSHRPDLATLEHRSQQLGARMAATMAAIDRAIREASRLVAGRAPTLPRGVEALACDMCGCHSDVTEDSDDGARLCGDCRWEAEHPEQCPEPSGAGRCGALGWLRHHPNQMARFAAGHEVEDWRTR